MKYSPRPTVPKPFTRSFDQVIAGVCGGLAEHLRISVVFVRLVFLVLALMQGLGVLVYVVLFFVMPAPHVQLIAARGTELGRLVVKAQRPTSLLVRIVTVLVTLVSGVIGLIGFVASVLGILDYMGFTIRDFFGAPPLSLSRPAAPAPASPIVFHQRERDEISRA